MEREDRKNLIISGSLFLVFIIYTLLVRFVDVQAIGPQGSSVGFAALNGAAAKIFPYNGFWYLLSKIVGYFAILLCLCFIATAVMQLIRGKSLKKVDRQLVVLLAFYVAIIFFYLFFEVVIINYRPVLKDGVLEASYPSTHTLLACCSFISAASQVRIRRFSSAKTISIVLYVLTAVLVLSRMFSGVHWLTDILGGVLLSAALLSGYFTALKIVDRNARRKRKNNSSKS